jgi:hypothetical protein
MFALGESFEGVSLVKNGARVFPAYAAYPSDRGKLIVNHLDDLAFGFVIVFAHGCFGV